VKPIDRPAVVWIVGPRFHGPWFASRGPARWVRICSQVAGRSVDRRGTGRARPAHHAPVADRNRVPAAIRIEGLQPGGTDRPAGRGVDRRTSVPRAVVPIDRACPVRSRFTEGRVSARYQALRLPGSVSIDGPAAVPIVGPRFHGPWFASRGPARCGADLQPGCPVQGTGRPVIVETLATLDARATGRRDALPIGTASPAAIRIEGLQPGGTDRRGTEGRGLRTTRPLGRVRAGPLASPAAVVGAMMGVCFCVCGSKPPFLTSHRRAVGRRAGRGLGWGGCFSGDGWRVDRTSTAHGKTRDFS